jgi:hypothetical protein
LRPDQASTRLDLFPLFWIVFVVLFLPALLVMRKGIRGLFRRLTYDPWRE